MIVEKQGRSKEVEMVDTGNSCKKVICKSRDSQGSSYKGCWVEKRIWSWWYDNEKFDRVSKIIGRLQQRTRDGNLEGVQGIDGKEPLRNKKG